MRVGAVLMVLAMVLPQAALAFSGAVVTVTIVDPPHVSAAINEVSDGYICAYSVEDADDEKVSARTALYLNGELVSEEPQTLLVGGSYSTISARAFPGDVVGCVVNATDSSSKAGSAYASLAVPKPASPTGFAIAAPSSGADLFAGIRATLESFLGSLLKGLFG